MKLNICFREKKKKSQLKGGQTMKEQKLSRSQIFQVYKLKEQAFEELYKQEHQELANEILQSIKKKEPTYEEAYAVLNLVHAKLQYESNFVHVLPTVKK